VLLHVLLLAVPLLPWIDVSAHVMHHHLLSRYTISSPRSTQWPHPLTAAQRRAFIVLTIGLVLPGWRPCRA
jgi:hypothetical protein